MGANNAFLSKRLTETGGAEIQKALLAMSYSRIRHWKLVTRSSGPLLSELVRQQAAPGGLWIIP